MTSAPLIMRWCRSWLCGGHGNAPSVLNLRKWPRLLWSKYAAGLFDPTDLHGRRAFLIPRLGNCCASRPFSATQLTVVGLAGSRGFFMASQSPAFDHLGPNLSKI